MNKVRNMQYKIILTILLLPVVSHAIETATGKDAQITELINTKLVIEDEAVKLASRMSKANKKLDSYTKDMLKLYRPPLDENDKKALIPERFKKVVFGLAALFDAGRSADVDYFIDKAFHKEAGTDVRLMCLKLIIQQLAVDRMTRQYRYLTEKLIATNKELGILQGISDKLKSESIECALN